ncbi:divergent polysaccharide deacetylase family protein [Oleiphilus sp. HI0079]|uniref:divergent polysaccharide deacetylase family protein n=1 Tax=Oleiphilus sp. HI0079 TaxID=1822254 RepID=UPI0009EEFEC4|nr:divergent polysaccharide deacetylase family protein [Oleiphilus sp. HI0079]
MPISIAIVIDDLGHHYERGKALVDMPYPLTLSFLPGRKYTLALSKRAYLAGKEVMLHAPMENTRQFPLGFGGLTSDMDKVAVQRSLQTSIVGVPHLVGLNNHMGSALTQNPKAMSWVMELVSSYPLYFLDSKTSASSVAASTAKRYGIPTMVRDVFLDHEQTPDYVEKQFEKLLDIAQRKGQAIAIAHPHKVTIDFLQEVLPSLGERGITIATASGLWQMKHPHRAMFPSQQRPRESNLAFSGEF